MVADHLSVDPMTSLPEDIALLLGESLAVRTLGVEEAGVEPDATHVFRL